MSMMSVRNIQPDYHGYGRGISDGYSESFGRYSEPLSGYPEPLRSTGSSGDGRRSGDTSYYSPTSVAYVSNSVISGYGSPIPLSSGSMDRSEPIYISNGYKSDPVSISYGSASFGYGSYGNQASAPSGLVRKRSPETFIGGDYGNPPSPSDMKPVDMSGRSSGVDRSQPLRRSSNRDEFSGPTQLLPRPPREYIAEQDRDLPHLPTNLPVQEQDVVLSCVNDRLSRCAFDFVAKYEFPIPVDPKMRPVERPEDREWTEWVYLLKRLATKRRIPARVLYNGQIKQLVTILENSLEMRHAARNQSRPLKDDRNILQLISAGIQVAKILKDASAMQYLDHLYVTTEQQIQDRSIVRGYLS